MGRCLAGYGRRESSLDQFCLAFVGGQNGPVAIGSAVDANPVRQALGVALRALNQGRFCKGVVGTAAVTAPLGNLAFWQRWHVELSPVFF